MELYPESFVVIAPGIAGMAIGAMWSRGGLRGSSGGPACRRCGRTCPAHGRTGVR